MRSVVLVLCVLAAGLLWSPGCAANSRFVGPDVPVPDDRQTAFVVNPELERERAVLEAAGLFELTNDPGAEVRLQLLPMESVSLVCGMPAIVTMYTFGLVPVIWPSTFELRFVLEGEGLSRTVSHVFTVARTVSVWENFRSSNEVEELGKALRAAAQGLLSEDLR